MIFTRYSLQFERALKNLTPNTEQATKKQNAIWAGFRKKEESYYFFPDPVILINNEPSLIPCISFSSDLKTILKTDLANLRFLSFEKGETCQSILIMLRGKIGLSKPEVKKIGCV